MPDPVLILASRDSCGSLLAALLGGHPEFYGAPHLNTLSFPKVWQFRVFAQIPRDTQIHGLWRFIGQETSGEQSMMTVQAARRWIGFREEIGPAAFHEELQALVAPRRLVDYSPLHIQNADIVRRALAACPTAKVIHLTKNPLAQARASCRPAWQTLEASLGWWVDRAENQPCMDVYEMGDHYIDWSVKPAVFDPQFSWHRCQRAALDVAPEAGPGRWMHLRAEDLLGDPQAVLARVLAFLDTEATPAQLEAMCAQGGTPWTATGSFEAPYGIDYEMIGHPVHRVLARAQSATPAHEPIDPAAPLPWRGDGDVLMPQVVALAADLGYPVTRSVPVEAPDFAHGTP